MDRKWFVAAMCAVVWAGFSVVARPDDAQASPEPPVTVRDDAGSWTLENAYSTAVVEKRTGNLTSLKYKNLELMGYGSGHPAGYWEQDPSRSRTLVNSITIDPRTNNGERAEVSVKGTTGGGSSTGGGAGGGTTCNIELRYTMGRHDHGLYAYAIYSHPPNYPNSGIGESRYGVKLNGDVFDWLSIDAKRNLKMISPRDWAQGIQLNAKEIRRITTGEFAGHVEHKYDYSADQFDTPAFGWSSTHDHVGFWFINPTVEFLSGGATKVELTGHLDLSNHAQPTLLDYWRGTHYGGSECAIAAGEDWTKIVGPIMLYVNAADTPDAMFKDALSQAGVEAAAWPYDWVKGVDYANKDRRGTVNGTLVLDDSGAPTPLTELDNLLVGLSAPGYDWQKDAKHYQFWTRGNKDGSFSIPKVRDGTYMLHAIADGVLGEFAQGTITVKNQQTVDLGTLTWKPVRYGKQLWDIGIANRSGIEFAGGDHYNQWGNFYEYAQLFPRDVNFEIGKSDFSKDWYYEQVPHSARATGDGHDQGRATPYTIGFALPGAPRGRGILRLAICGVAARSIAVTVNGKQVAPVTQIKYNATINRDGVAGYWVERDVVFDASLLRAGHNAIVLTIPPGGLTSGIIYDYLRLELNEVGGGPPIGLFIPAGNNGPALGQE
ncbi:MAG: polysaccharide lyase family protein [Planctomycetota bacterium]|nr:polysaccharide lyase family protein [Planctomycetota bacterium]